MKLYVLAFALLVAIPVVAEKTSWTNQRSEESEMEAIRNDVATIKERHKQDIVQVVYKAIFDYLKKVRGTSASFKVLKELIEGGELPKHFLNEA